MLKLILLLLFLYLVLRLVLKAVGAGVVIRRWKGGSGSEPDRSTSSQYRQVEEADYEVLDTQLHDEPDDSR
jgi:hypothetical protein